MKRLLLIVITICLISVHAFAEGSSIDMMLRQANEGNVDTQFQLGVVYLAGAEVKQDVDKSVEWFERASKNGDTRAMFALGTIYFVDDFKKKDLKMSEKWLLRAAEKDMYDAQFALAEEYISGQSFKKSLEKAEYWYTRGAMNGITESQMLLAKFYKEHRKDMVSSCAWSEILEDSLEVIACNRVLTLAQKKVKDSKVYDLDAKIRKKN